MATFNVPQPGQYFRSRGDYGENIYRYLGNGQIEQLNLINQFVPQAERVNFGNAGGQAGEALNRLQQQTGISFPSLPEYHLGDVQFALQQGELKITPSTDPASFLGALNPAQNTAKGTGTATVTPTATPQPAGTLGPAALQPQQPVAQGQPQAPQTPPSIDTPAFGAFGQTERQRVATYKAAGLPLPPQVPQQAPQTPQDVQGGAIQPEAPQDTTSSLSTTLAGFMSDKNAFATILSQIKESFGFDAGTKEIEKLDTQQADEVAAISDNPWLSESLRDRRIKSAQEKYTSKRDALVNRLRLNQDIVGKALDVFHKERELQKDTLFKQLDLRSKELDRQARAERAREVPSIEEYNLAKQQGFKGTLLDFLEVRRPTPASILLQTGQIDRLLTSNEQIDYGVAAGTKLSEVVGIIPLADAARKQLTTKASALATLSEIEKISRKVNTFGPGFLGINRLIEGGQLSLGALTQTNPDAAQLISQKGILATIIRGLGEVGTLATADVERALALIPGVTTTKEVAQRNLQEIRNILAASGEAVRQGAQTQIRPGQQQVAPSGLKYKIKKK